MEVKLRTKYDEKADAAYIYLNDSAEVKSTMQIDSDVMLDLDKDKKVVGIELLKAKEKLNIPELLQSSPQEGL